MWASEDPRALGNEEGNQNGNAAALKLHLNLQTVCLKHFVVSFTFGMNHVCPPSSRVFICSHAVTALSHTHTHQTTQKQTN